MSKYGGKFIRAGALAELLRITPRQVQSLVKSGVIPRHSRGNYELVPAVHAYLNWKEGKKGGDAIAPGHDPSTELTVIKVQRARIELQKETGALVPVHGLQSYAEQLGAVMHSALETLPGQMKTMIPHLRAGELKQIRTLLVRVQNGIASVDFIHKRAA